MSGGYFDYFNSDMPIVSMAIVISFAKGKYKPETIKEFRRCLKYLKLADVYLHRADWLLSGDDGEESFHERLKEDLDKLKSEKAIKVQLQKCKICSHYYLNAADDEDDYINSRHRGRGGKTYSFMCIDPHAADYGGYTLEEQLERCKNFEKDASRCWDFSPCKKWREKELH